jgi:hypothetical protein
MQERFSCINTVHKKGDCEFSDTIKKGLIFQ